MRRPSDAVSSISWHGEDEWQKISGLGGEKQKKFGYLVYFLNLVSNFSCFTE
jgi:hypothetical protein